jgi:adenylate kinase
VARKIRILEGVPGSGKCTIMDIGIKIVILLDEEP